MNLDTGFLRFWCKYLEFAHLTNFRNSHDPRNAIRTRFTQCGCCPGSSKMTNCKPHCRDLDRLSLPWIIGYFKLLDPERSLCSFPWDGTSSWVLVDFFGWNGFQWRWPRTHGDCYDRHFHYGNKSIWIALPSRFHWLCWDLLPGTYLARVYKASFDSPSPNLSPVRYLPSSKRSATSNLTSVRPFW